MKNAITQNMPDGSTRTIEWTGRYVSFFLKREGITLQFVATIRATPDADTHQAAVHYLDVGYHSPRPTYKGERLFSEKCRHTDDGPCYYGGTSLGAERLMDDLLCDGMDRVWEELEARWNSVREDVAIVGVSEDGERINEGGAK